MDTRDVISLIAKIRRGVNRLIISEMENHGLVGIVTSHGDIIYALFQAPGLTMTEIAEKIGRDKSTVTALVNKLVRLGYVKKERDIEDARVVDITLTDKGRELEPVFEKISKELIDTFYSGITEKEKGELIKILSKINLNIG